jgi:large subunit ribosomal protein L4
MAKIAVYNLSGEKTKDLDVQDSVFAVPSKKEVVHQVYVAMQANARQPWADTKDKSEVRGGGKKPWKQKGTGRARHGSTRSPIWSGGGITFGPLSIRSYKQKINKKVKRQAVQMCLSDKVSEQKLFALESMDLSAKTKEVSAMYSKLPGAGRKTLVLVDGMNSSLLRATRNIKKIDVMQATDVSVVDLMHHQYVVADEAALKVLGQRFSK